CPLGHFPFKQGRAQGARGYTSGLHSVVAMDFFCFLCRRRVMAILPIQRPVFPPWMAPLSTGWRPICLFFCCPGRGNGESLTSRGLATCTPLYICVASGRMPFGGACNHERDG